MAKNARKKATARNRRTSPSLQSVLSIAKKRLHADITPVMQQVKQVVGALESELKKQKLKAKIILGGSLAKNTYLPGDHDVDIFVAFDYFHKFHDISKLLGGVLGKLKHVSVARVHGSRDYFQLTTPASPLTFEIIPVLDIKDPDAAANITDCSPLHVSWVKKQIAKKKKLADDIKLTKAFCKAAGVYGAESYIKGFSGHVVDILTIYYGGFVKLLTASQSWKDKTIIDFYNAHKGSALQVLNASKLQSPLIVVDPIQKERNAAAALDYSKGERFKVKAHQFLKQPTIEFFIKKELTLDDIKQRAGKNKLVLIDVVARQGKEDVVGAKLLKAFEYIKRQLQKNEFDLYDAGWVWNKGKKALFFFILNPALLPPTRCLIGPAVSMAKYVAHFKAMHKKTFEKNGRVFAEVLRRFRTPESLVAAVLKEPYVAEKMVSARIIGGG